MAHVTQAEWHEEWTEGPVDEPRPGLWVDVVVWGEAEPPGLLERLTGAGEIGQHVASDDESEGSET